MAFMPATDNAAFEVVILFEDGSDCATAGVDDLVDATVEAMNMYRHTLQCPVLRRNGHVINHWLGTNWAHPLAIH